MKITTVIDETREEEIFIRLSSPSDLPDRIRALLGEETELVGYYEDEIVKLSLSDIYCFYIESAKLYASVATRRYLLKDRLCNIESLLENTPFLKINQSCIINPDKIEKFKVSIGGALIVLLKNGHSDYVSRRQLKAVKERLGLSK